MFRLAILLISLIWASLLLISWGGPGTSGDLPAQVAASTTTRF